jgi:hypothetical protein
MRPILTSIGVRPEGAPSGTVRTGGGAVFEIGYDAGGSRFDYAFLALSTPLGERVCSVGTHLSPGFGGAMSGAGVLECRLPGLPLAGGEYRVLIAIGTRVPQQNVDVVEDALRFEVDPADFFGTGTTLLPGQGALAQRSEWRVVPDSGREARAGAAAAAPGGTIAVGPRA